MIWRRGSAAALAVLFVTVLAGCATTVTGAATWPGARLDRVVLDATDFPPGVQYDRFGKGVGESDAAGGPPAMLSRPTGCSDGLTRVIAGSAERGPGSAAEYLVAYDGARMVMTVLTSPLDLERLEATADRCASFETFFDPSEPGIPMTTTPVPTDRPGVLIYRQTMKLGGTDNSIYFSFENIGNTAVFGVAFPTPNPAIAIKGTLPQTFLDTVARQVDRIEAP